jgi:hypothetical protein
VGPRPQRRRAGWLIAATLALWAIGSPGQQTSDSVTNAEDQAAAAGAEAARLKAPPVAEPADVDEEIIVTGIRRHEPEWRPPPIEEEPENDWRRRDADGNVESGRIEFGRSSVYQDISDRRRNDMFRDEYRDPRPQTSFRFSFGGGKRKD